MTRQTVKRSRCYQASIGNVASVRSCSDNVMVKRSFVVVSRDRRTVGHLNNFMCNMFLSVEL